LTYLRISYGNTVIEPPLMERRIWERQVLDFLWNKLSQRTLRLSRSSIAQFFYELEQRFSCKVEFDWEDFETNREHYLSERYIPEIKLIRTEDLESLTITNLTNEPIDHKKYIVKMKEIGKIEFKGVN